MDQRLGNVFLAPGITEGALEGFDPDLLRNGSLSQNYERVHARMTEESVREKVSVLVAPRNARKLPKDTVVEAVSEYVSGKKSAILSNFGLDFSRNGSLEAVAFAFLENGYPELSAKVAKAAFESSADSAFRHRFCEVYLAALDHTDFSEISKYLAQELASWLQIVRESLKNVAQDGHDHFYLARLFESFVFKESEGDLNFAVESYQKALSLGATAAIWPMAELLFRSQMEEEGMEFLEAAWEKYRLPDTIRDLGNRYMLRGDYAKGLRCSRIVSLLADEGQVVATAPSEKNIVFPLGMFVCQSFLLTRERAGGMGAFLRKPVMRAAHEWLSKEVEKISDTEYFSQNDLEEAFENRLALLQFGAVELSDPEYAIRYLKELDFHMLRNEGKEFLMEYFEENWSPYAKAYVYRIEEESLDFVTQKGTEYWDSASEVEPRIHVPNEVFSDVGDAIATHLAYVSYRFQSIGDEDVMEKLKETAALVRPADDRVSNTEIASAVESNAEDFRERGRMFDALSGDLRNWYADLRSRIVESRGQSFFRWLFSNIYFPNGGRITLGGNELMFHIVETYFSGSEIAPENLETMLGNLLGSGISDDDIAHLSEFLFESQEFSAGLDLALSMKDPSNPKILRHIIRSALHIPELAESIDEDFQARLSELGANPISLTDFSYDEMVRAPNSPIVRGNLAMAYHAFARNPKLLLKTALPAYEKAFALGDIEAGMQMARLFAYEFDNLAEGRKRMLAVYNAGEPRILPELCDVAWKMGDKEAFHTYLSMAEQYDLPKTEEFRLMERFDGDFEAKIQVLELLPGCFAPPKREVSSTFVDECRKFAFSVFSKLETDVPADFEALRPGLVAARMLTLFPEEREKGKKPLVKDRFPMVAYYLAMIEKLLSSLTEGPKFLEFLQGLSDLRLTAIKMTETGDVSEEYSVASYVMADIQHLSEVMSGTSGHADLLLRSVSVLRKVPGGEAFANEIAERLSPPSEGNLQFH